MERGRTQGSPLRPRHSVRPCARQAWNEGEHKVRPYGRTIRCGHAQDRHGTRANTCESHPPRANEPVLRIAEKRPVFPLLPGLLGHPPDPGQGILMQRLEARTVRGGGSRGSRAPGGALAEKRAASQRPPLVNRARAGCILKTAPPAYQLGPPACLSQNQLGLKPRRIQLVIVGVEIAALPAGHAPVSQGCERFSNVAVDFEKCIGGRHFRPAFASRGR